MAALAGTMEDVMFYRAAAVAGRPRTFGYPVHHGGRPVSHVGVHNDYCGEFSSKANPGAKHPPYIGTSTWFASNSLPAASSGMFTRSGLDLDFVTPMAITPDIAQFVRRRRQIDPLDLMMLLDLCEEQS